MELKTVDWFETITQLRSHAYEEGYKAGIKEVVDWIKPRIAMAKGGLMSTNIDWVEWQAKLKEWGIDAMAT